MNKNGVKKCDCPVCTQNWLVLLAKPCIRTSNKNVRSDKNNRLSKRIMLDIHTLYFSS